MRAPRCDAARGGRRCATRKARGPGGRHGKRRPRRERGGGAQLNYDNEGRLVSWENAPSSPTTSTDAFASDGEGSRIAQKTVSNGVTTTTDYLLGGLEEVTGGTLTEYFPMPGTGTAVRVGSTLSYLASDNLGSVSVALSSNGTVTAQQLYGPYGGVRYSSGTMPIAHGYTGQVADAVTGLDYYGARYYDPSLGQFASADTALDGLNRYAYVGGNPESATDPSGHEVDILPDKVGAIGAGAPTAGGGSALVGALITATAVAVTLLGLAALQIYEDANPLIRMPTRAAQNVLNHHWGPMAGAAVRWGDGLDYAPKIKSAYAPKVKNPPPPPPPPPGPGPTPPATQTGGGGANGGAGVTPPTGSCGCDWIWIYHGSNHQFEQFDVSKAIEDQQARPWRHLELGNGIYFTDELDRAGEYLSNALTGRVYGAKAPVNMLARLRSSTISTNNSRQWVVDQQADADVLNQTIEWRTWADIFTGRNPFPEDPC